MDYRDLNNNAETIEDLREWYKLDGIENSLKTSQQALKETKIVEAKTQEEYQNLAKQVETGITSLDNYCNIAYLYNDRIINCYYQESEPALENIGDLWLNTELNIPYILVDSPRRWRELEELSHNRALANINMVNARGLRTFYIKDKPETAEDGDFYLDNNRRLYEYKNDKWELAINYIDSAFSRTIYEALEEFKVNDFHNATHMINSETGTIESITEHIERNRNSINSIEQDVSGIKLKQDNTINFTNYTTGKDKVLVEDASDTELLELSYKVEDSKETYLYPSSVLYPRADLYPNARGEHN